MTSPEDGEGYYWSLRRTAAAFLFVAAGTFSSVTAAESVLREPVDSGGGEKVLEAVDELTEEQRKEIQERLDKNIALLRAEGKLPAHPLSSAEPLTWPLRQTNGLHVFDQHSIPVFVDLDPAYPFSRLDYNCGTRTYDLPSGYNHGGTDFVLWPFPWLWMDNSQVAVVAVAPGTLIQKDDGWPDKSCDNLTETPWNAVYIGHDGLDIVWYGHLKQGSLTTKLPGERVERGEYLGLVGSSGRSNVPHLHFEMHGLVNEVIDPFGGPCNTLPSLWQDQRPYYHSRINMLMTGWAPPQFRSCPLPEVPNAQIDFDPGDTIYFSAFWHDQLFGQPTQFKIYQPDGSVWNSWSHASGSAHTDQSWWYWAYSFAGAPSGIWKFEATFEGRVYEHYFSIGGPFTVGSVPSGGTPGAPLTVEALPGGDLELSWGVSCASSETDWAIYEGSLGQYYSHVPKQCSTGGQTSAEITPASADSYYLVAGRNEGWEGSHGTNGEGIEIPPPADACRLQNIGVCDPCGDNVIMAPEVCDGTDLGGETCLSQGFDGGSLSCNAACDGFLTSGCTTVCGDMMRRGNETCDGSDLGGQTCVSQGFDGGSLSCNAGCNGFVTSGCTTICGNGTRSGAELCDGADLGGQTCATQGFVGGTLACNGTCSGFITSGCTTCGNNVRNPGEVCDGTDLAGQTCVSLGFDPGILSCNSTCSAFVTFLCGI